MSGQRSATKTQRPVWTRGTVDVATREAGDTERPIIKRQPIKAEIWSVFAVHEAVRHW